MHRCFRPSSVAMALAWCAVSVSGALAGERIHRCIGSGGEIAFSDVPCRAMDAAPAGTVLLDEVPQHRSEPPLPDIVPQGAPTSCATSGEDLRERIAAAVGARDTNSLAGLLRWRGVPAREADRRLRELRELVKRPLLAVDADGYAIADDAVDAFSADAGLRVRTGDDAGSVREHRFGIEPADGCYWLSW